MRRCLLQASLSLLLILSRLTPAAIAWTPLELSNPGNGTVELGGEWQFHPGDDAAWASPAFDDSQWKQIRTGKSWGAQGHYGYTGFAWYRRQIAFKPDQAMPGDLALFFPPIRDAYEIFWNGALIGSFGALPPHPLWFYEPPPHTFAFHPQGSGVLAIRVWKAPLGSAEPGVLGGLTGTPLLGSSRAIADHKGRLDHIWLRNHQYEFDLNLLNALVVVVAFLGWIRNRAERTLFWVSMFAFARVLHMALVHLRLPIPCTVSIGLLIPADSLRDVSLWFLLLYLLELDRISAVCRATRTLATISIGFSILDGLICGSWALGAQGPGTAKALQIADAITTVPFTVVQLFSLVLVYLALASHSRRRRIRKPSWVVALFAALAEMLSVVRWGAAQGSRYTHLTLADLLAKPVFSIRGNDFYLETIASTLLFGSLVFAVHRYSIARNQRQNAMEQEFRSAQELQRMLIPETLPSLAGYAITSAYRPAQEVGGDFFQLIAESERSALLVLGDVSGKGLPAAMTVALILGTLRTLVESTNDPAEILSGLNRLLHGRLKGGFATCLILCLETGGDCTIANAGQLAPFLNNQEMTLPPALPLGPAAEAEYDTVKFRLEVDDRLTLYTDGLLEARNHAGELYGFERVEQLVATRPDAIQACKAAIRFGQEDDITVLTVTRLEMGAAASTVLLEAQEQPKQRRLSSFRKPVATEAG